MEFIKKYKYLLLVAGAGLAAYFLFLEDDSYSSSLDALDEAIEDMDSDEDLEPGPDELDEMAESAVY